MNDRADGIPSQFKAAALVILSLISAALPWLVVFGLQDPIEHSESPAQVAYYRQTVGGLMFSLGVAGFVVLLRTKLDWRKAQRTILGIGAFGILFSCWWLFVLVGLCGPSVLWGYCYP